ncbi:MAG: organic solvent tolerance protein OstA [Treponema sp.]|nr:organic solvent tolerance protein OstA [Candidatus Treponema scatequi]
MGDSLKWNGKTEQLVSAKGQSITIKKDDLVITGKDFSASAVSNTFLFSDSVSGSQVFVNADGSNEDIRFSGDSMQGSVSNSKDSAKQNSTILSGNAMVTTSTMEIRADSIELTGNDFNVIKANGNIRGVNSESEIEFSAQTLEYNRDTKIVVLSGGVELKDTKNDVTAKAQIIEYDQNTDVAIMQIEVELKQKQNVCTGAYSVYRKKEQTLELSGNASVKQSEDTFRAQYISFNMETEEIVMDGNIRGTVTTKKSE